MTNDFLIFSHLLLLVSVASRISHHRQDALRVRPFRRSVPVRFTVLDWKNPNGCVPPRKTMKMYEICPRVGDRGIAVHSRLSHVIGSLGNKPFVDAIRELSNPVTIRNVTPNHEYMNC